MAVQPLGIRWTIGDVSEAGFEALRLSICGAHKAFGPDVRYAVCVNTISLEQARSLTGSVPSDVCFVDATSTIPEWLKAHLDAGLAQGAAWKFAPLRFFHDRHELSLDNDCILWELPQAILDFCHDEDGVLVAEDVCAMAGQFSSLCGEEPRNLGIRGLPRRFDLTSALQGVLRELPATLRSELDEQGLQLAALHRAARMHVVRVADVSICSPFPPHVPWLGRCGAHFCGLNVRTLGWALEGRPAEAHVQEHWARHRAELYARVGLSMPVAASQ